MKQSTKKIIAIVAPIVAVILIAAVVVGILFGTGVLGGESRRTLKQTYFKNGTFRYTLTGEGDLPAGTYVTMTVTAKYDSGKEKSKEITFIMLPEYAEETVANFLTYVNEGYYENTCIHRVVKSTYTFQGGSYVYDEEDGTYESVKDVSAKADGESDFAYRTIHDPIKGEFSENGYEKNTIGHFAGTIAMARTSENDSATAGFYINYADYDGWNGKYAAFGFLIYEEDIEFIRVLAEGTEDASGVRINDEMTVDSNDFPQDPVVVISNVKATVIK